MVITLPDHPPRFSFDSNTAPVLRAESGMSIRLRTGDAAYVAIDGAAIDSGRVDFQRANALAGPVFVEGARPGDAIGLRIDEIEIDRRAFAVYVSRWRETSFSIPNSRVVTVQIDSDGIRLPSGGAISARPMIGCIGVAPRSGHMSSLGPTGSTGGNMDLVELRAGATIWFPVEVEGGLLSLGDLHARMGRGEPLGSGLECGGMVIGTICLEPNARPSGPVLCDDRRITFVGTSDVDWRDAERKAVRAAWDWLTGVCGVPQDDAIVLSATLLEVNAGGPAGNNAVASIAINELVRANVRTDVWPLAIARNS